MNNQTWRILLVEDDEDDYLLTRGLLSELQDRRFSLTWADDIEMALDCLEKDSPDVILVDYALGPASGLDFIRKARRKGCAAPLILLTGHGDYEIDLQAMQAGAADYLPKADLTAPALERSIRYAIDHQQAEALLVRQNAALQASAQALQQARDELEQRVSERTADLAKANTQLEQANALLEQVFAGIHLQIAYLDRDFNFLRVNRNYSDANGQPPEFFLGKNHFDLYPDPEAEAIFRSVVETGKTYFTFARPFRNPLQPERDVTLWDWSLQPVMEPAPSGGTRVGGLVLSLLDVTEREQAASSLREREQQLRAVATGAPVILWVVDSQGIITLLEGRGLSKVHLVPGQLVGKSIFEWEALGLEAHENLRLALAGEEVTSVVEVMEGTFFYTHFTPRVNASGRVTGVISVSTDITERVQAEAQIAFQAGLLNRVSDAILATDEKGCLTAWNRAAERIYGWAEEEVIGRPASELLRTEFETITGPAAQRILEETGQFEAEVMQYDRNGQPLHIDMQVTGLRDETGRRAGYVSVNRDLTDRKRIQAELAEVQRRLIESVEAERLHIAQDLHDGPLQDLYALAYEMEGLRPALGETPDRRLVDSYQAKIRQVCQALRGTATELRPPTLTPFGLEKAIRSHAGGFQQEHPELQVRLNLDHDGQSLSERTRLALFRIYQQGLANVIRHSAASHVEVSLALDDGVATLEVKDDGRGFELPDRWVELAREGHLGLVGAQERASAVGGKFEVISKPGEGTVIRVVVPRS